MSAPRQFTVRDGGIVSLWDIITDKPLALLTLMKGMTLNTQSTTVYSTGGRGNGSITSHSGDKKGNLEMQTQIYDVNAMSILTGGRNTIGATAIHWNEELVVKAEGKVTLSHTPVGLGTGLENIQGVFTIAGTGNGDEVGVTAITGKELTLNEQDAAEGDKVRVFYKIMTSIDAVKTTTDVDKFPNTIKVVADILVSETCSDMTYDAQLIVPKIRPNDQLSLALQNTGDPTTFTLGGEILTNPCGQRTMYELIVYDRALLPIA